MLQHVHFISGLPRSGSTLLSAILKQNPRFHAAMSGPVASILGAVQPKMSVGEFSQFFDDRGRSEMMRGIFQSYYKVKVNDLTDGTVVFDTNRIWTAKAALLAELYPNSKIICCVRDISWIIDSIENMLSKNPLRLSGIFNFEAGSSVYERVEMLMNSEHGLVGLAWSSLREAWFGRNANRLIVVPYDSLVKNPRETLVKLYDELGEQYFDHDFQNVDYNESEYDLNIGMPGLHTVRRAVEYRDRKPCIPPDLFAKYASTQFWQHKELNVRNVKIL